MAKNTARLPPIVFLPVQARFHNPNSVSYRPTKAPRGSAKKIGLIISKGIRLRRNHDKDEVDGDTNVSGVRVPELELDTNLLMKTGGVCNM